MRVFLAVHLPKLPLEVLRPKWSSELASGSAVPGKDKAVIANNVARAVGIRHGMKRAARIEARWLDGELVAGDIFAAQRDDQCCFWIYREPVSSRDAEEDPRWFFHGLFG